ncbi:MAG: aminoglycoside N(3)-acetyltransferase [Chloroflexota bacterium]|nr:MAG: aminoglycoside N(3)-acetyltransferase [Chloroflexota bacterium]
MEKPVALTQAVIEQNLRLLGLERGMAVEVHSSLSRFGRVEGGAATVIAALMNVVGEEGALVMPAFALTLPLPLSDEDKARGILAKVRFLPPDTRERTGMGIIADTFRRCPGVITGPGFHRVCAWGRDAQRHSQGYQYLLDSSGWTLLLGVDIHRCTSMHYAEGKVGLPEEVRAFFDTNKEILRDYPAEQWYVETVTPPEDAWGKIQAEADRRGFIRHRRIGAAECMFFRACDVVGLYEQALRTDPWGLYGIRKREAS